MKIILLRALIQILSAVSIFGPIFSAKLQSLIKCHICQGTCKDAKDEYFDGCCLSAGNTSLPEHEEQRFQNKHLFDTCLGDNCFVSMEQITNTSFTVKKGCVSGTPYASEGCYLVGTQKTKHCICKGDYCSDQKQMLNTLPKPAAQIECCKCLRQKEGEDEACPNEKCAGTCRGNYCSVDFERAEQDCGVGVPPIASYLRMSLQAVSDSLTCARIQAGPNAFIHGCICNDLTGSCNELNRTKDFQLNNVILRRSDDLVFCHSLHTQGRTALEESDFRRSEICEGHFCFIKRTSLRSDGDSDSGESSELLAGCLKVDSDDKVQVGCTDERLTNLSKPSSRYCVCDSNMCNNLGLASSDTERGKVPNNSAGHTTNRFLFVIFCSVLFWFLKCKKGQMFG